MRPYEPPSMGCTMCISTVTVASLRPLRAPYITVRDASNYDEIHDDKPISGDAVLKTLPLRCRMD